MVTDSVCAVAFAQNERVNDIAERFAHLLSVKGYPAVNCKVLRERQVECHKHCGPDDSVETHDILCDHVDIGRPILVIVIVCAVLIAESCNIVGKCVYPDVNNVVGVKSYGNSPLEARSRNAEIFKTRLDEVVYKLGRSCLRTEVVCFGEKLLDAVCKRRHFEEVSLFLSFDNISSALGAFAVNELGFCPEAFARSTVFSDIFTLINVSSVVKLLEDFLYGLNMVIVGSADIAVVADAHTFPKLFEGLYDLINVFLWSNSRCLSFFFDLLTMLVRSGEEHNIIALHTLVSCNSIAGNGRVAVSDVRISRWVIDRGRDIKRFLWHKLYPPVKIKFFAHIIPYYI